MADPVALLGGVTLADGGWSTQLQRRGVPTNVPAETANITHPDIVRGLVEAYLEAGSQIILTNTFSANRLACTRQEVPYSVTDLNRQGAALAKEVAAARAVVAGSIGPSGKILAVRETTEEQLAEVFAEQAQALAAGGADWIVLETFSELAEILLALRVVKESTGLPVVASMSYDAGPQRTRTMMGARAEECAATLEEAGADVIGMNCGSGIENALPVVVTLRAHTARPLWVKPNAGMPELEDGRAVWKQTPADFAGFARPLIEAGANVMGGCCGSAPEHIRALAGLLAKRGGRS